MAGVVSGGTTTPIVNGSRSHYDAVGAASQENNLASKSRPPNLSRDSSSSTRTPLSSLAPNRKESGGIARVSHSRVEELGQSETKLPRSGSEPDSLLDLYRNNQSSGNVSRQGGNDNDIPENMYRPADDDPEGWIHRDKLAKIESEELQAAGINLANARRTGVGKAGARRDTSLSRPSEERSPSDYRRAETEETNPRTTDVVEEEDERENWDFRSPEEIAADDSPSQMYSHPVLRKSGSKIPVLTSSPLPIPQQRIERDTPLIRKRTISNSMSPEDGIPVFKTRKRKESNGSSPLRDEDDLLGTTPVPTNGGKLATPKTSSPTKGRPKTAQSPSAEAIAGRKGSATNTRKPSANAAKAAATPSPNNQRPGTRSGELDRPRTAVNRPEGDPPWLATMYKPDPMLPPDQQIIPTHARRQQQAQWEHSGAVPTTYDRNFSPLAIHTGNGGLKAVSPALSSTSSVEKEENNNAWPLKPVPSVRDSTNSGRPGTGGSANGGYSTMPRVTSPAIMQSPRMGNISSTPTQPGRVQVQRLQPHEMDEKVKDKTCGCCVVM